MRLSSASWRWIYSRMVASSFPTVETKYPRAQKCSPTKFRFRPPYRRAIQMALFPFRKPITWDTAYFGGMLISMFTWSSCRLPERISLSFGRVNSAKTRPNSFRIWPYRTFRRYLGMKTTWYLHSHQVCDKLAMSSITVKLWEFPGRAGGVTLITQSGVQLITHMRLERSCESNADCQLPALDALADRGIDPETRLADTSFGSQANYEAYAVHGIELIAPLPGSVSCASPATELDGADGFVVQCFPGDLPSCCPAGVEAAAATVLRQTTAGPVALLLLPAGACAGCACQAGLSAGVRCGRPHGGAGGSGRLAV